MVACLALVLGLKALTLLGNGEILLTSAPQYKAAHTYALAIQQAFDHAQEKHIIQATDKASLHASGIFEESNASKAILKKEFKIKLKQVFASFANYAFSSRVLAFFKSHSSYLALTENHPPLYELDGALLI